MKKGWPLWIDITATPGALAAPVQHQEPIKSPRWKPFRSPRIKQDRGNARQPRSRRRKATMAWRWLGSVMQPLLGTTNYLLGPLKPVHKPVVLPTGVYSCPDTPAMLQ